MTDSSCAQVMIVGNHSAGKSSFINWYIGEGIQKTVSANLTQFMLHACQSSAAHCTPVMRRAWPLRRVASHS